MDLREKIEKDFKKLGQNSLSFFMVSFILCYRKLNVIEV